MTHLNKSYLKTMALLFVALFSLVACSNQPTQEKTEEPSALHNQISLTNEQIKNAGITLGKIEQMQMSDQLKLNGKVEVPPQNLISVCVPMGGYLKSTKLLPGMQVKKGEVLAVLEDQQYVQLQQDYLTANAQFEYLKTELERQRDLNVNKANSDKVYEQTKANYQSQLVLMRSLEQKLRLIGINSESLTADNISRSISLLSPVNGFVSGVFVNIGRYVNPPDVLFELIDPSDIHLSLTAYEKDVEKLAVGQRIQAFTNNAPDKMYECEIILVSKNLESNNTATVHCHFLQKDVQLLPGTFMNARVNAISMMSNVLPEEAIVRFENKHFVFVDNGNGTYEMIPILMGKTQYGKSEVLSAEALLDKSIVQKGAYNLLMTLKNTGE